MELWVTWGSQDWAWTPFLLLRALPSPSDKEETDVINEQGDRLEIRWVRGSWLAGVQLEVSKLPSGGGSQGEPGHHFPKRVHSIFSVKVWLLSAQSEAGSWWRAKRSRVPGWLGPGAVGTVSGRRAPC